MHTYLHAFAYMHIHTCLSLNPEPKPSKAVAVPGSRGGLSVPLRADPAAWLLFKALLSRTEPLKFKRLFPSMWGVLFLFGVNIRTADLWKLPRVGRVSGQDHSCDSRETTITISIANPKNLKPPTQNEQAIALIRTTSPLRGLTF